MSSSRRNYLLLFVVAALLGVTSMQASGQAKRKGQPRSGRPARVSGSVQAGLTPTTALRAYYRALMNDDITTAKKYLSAGSIRLMEADAGSQGKSLDEAMKEEAGRNPTGMPKFTNERITGVTALVDMTQQGMIFEMSLVKEGGEWKLDLEKMLEDGRIAPPTEPAAEGVYSEDEEHRLFQAVGITKDAQLIIEVAQRLGLADSSGVQTPKFNPFVQAHYEWAAKNFDFVLEHRDEEKARAYVIAHK